MKKLVSLALSVALALSLTACTLLGVGLPQNPNTPGGNTDTESSFDQNKVTFLAAYDEATRLGFEGTLDEFIALISGKDGVNGQDGVGISNVLINNSGNLIVLLTSGATIDCGKVTGKDGAPGKDGVDGAPGKDGVTPTIEISEDGYWVINGVKTEYKAIGTDGKDGVDGEDGKDGVDGAPGKDGVDGEDGKDGVDGAPGKDGVTPTIEISEDGYWVINGVKTEYKAVADGNGNTHPHSFSEWVRYTYDPAIPCDAWLSYRICSACKMIEWKNGGYDNHTITTVTVEPTCVSEGYDINTCSVCGFSEKVNFTAVKDHEYNEEYSNNASFHWLDCKHCDATTAYGEHTVDDSGYCTTCDEPLSPTVGIIYDVSIDGTCAEVIGYEGTARRIVIADTYNGLPVKAIYKSVFRKKNITS